MNKYYQDERVTLLLGDSLDVLRALPDASVDCCVTSPPYYGLRDYGVDGQYGLEATPAEYVEVMRAVFAEVRRVLVSDGTCWINLGDSYATQRSWDGSSGRSDRKGASAEAKPVTRPANAKNLLMIPARVAIALQDDGWTLRNSVIWAKENPMPESVTDRLAQRHEHIYLLSKGPKYWFDLDAIRVPHSGPRKSPGAGDAARAVGPADRGGKSQWHRSRRDRERTARHPLGRNPGDVWTINVRPYAEAHFAVMPPELASRCIRAGCKPGGVVLDPFSGSGTTGEAARMLGRRYVGIDLNPAYHNLAIGRFAQGVLDFEEAS